MHKLSFVSFGEKLWILNDFYTTFFLVNKVSVKSEAQPRQFYIILQSQAFDITYIKLCEDQRNINHAVSHGNWQACHAAAVGLQPYITVTTPTVLTGTSGYGILDSTSEKERAKNRKTSVGGGAFVYETNGNICQASAFLKISVWFQGKCPQKLPLWEFFFLKFTIKSIH